MLVSCTNGSCHKLKACAAVVRCAMLARLWSAVLVQTKGLGFTLCTSVVRNDMHIQPGGNLCFDHIEELANSTRDGGA